ncbi:MAG: hypothetical protein ACK6DY_24120 [Acidobacteriota bacterium]
MLELLALRRLPAESRSELLLHLQACTACRQNLQAELQYIETIRAVLSVWPVP